MAITHVQQQDTHATNQATVTLTPITIGNLLTLKVKIIGSSAATVTGVTDTGITPTIGSAKWTLVTSSARSSGIYDRVELWMATVNAVPGSATVTVTYSVTPAGSCELMLDEWNSGLGPAAAWSVVTSNVLVSASNVTTITFPTLTTTLAGELYEGYAMTGGTPSAGSTAGFSYGVPFNINTWNPACAAVTAETPTAPSTSAAYNSVAAIYSASIPPPPSAHGMSVAVSRAVTF